jgi:hypothetical protein
VTAKQSALKKYIVKLSGEERDRLTALIKKGQAPARQQLKARILLKAAEAKLIALACSPPPSGGIATSASTRRCPTNARMLPPRSSHSPQ